MAVLTLIDGIPLYSTYKEALAWAKSRGLSGYHTHSFEGVLGYMGGINHESIKPKQPGFLIQNMSTRNLDVDPTQRIIIEEEPELLPTPIPEVDFTTEELPETIMTPTPTPVYRSSGGSSGGGGGY